MLDQSCFIINGLPAHLQYYLHGYTFCFCCKGIIRRPCPFSTQVVNFSFHSTRFYLFGIYVIMFIEVLKTLLKAMCVFSILIVAFGFVFYILFQNEVCHRFSSQQVPHIQYSKNFLLNISKQKSSKTNSTWIISILRTIGMSTGELDASDTFILPLSADSPYEYHYSQTTVVFMILFIILVPILLTNLLVTIKKKFDLNTFFKTECILFNPSTRSVWLSVT
jgi:hypothetical protein